jgi:hypothetical protein
MELHLIDHGCIREDVLLIHGACGGADTIADTIAKRLGWWVVSCPADWSIGRGAGPNRNQAMLDEFHPEQVLAFPVGESKGTRDMIRRAVAAKIPCITYESAQDPTR